MRIAALALVLAGCGDDPEASEPPAVSVCEAVQGDRLEPEGARRIASVLAGPPTDEITQGVPGSAAIDAGAAYLDAFSITGGDLVEGTLRESE